MTLHAQIAEWAWPVPPAATAEAAAADPTEARLRAVVLDILHPMSLVDDNYDMESAWVAVSTQAFERAAEVTQLAAQLPAPHLPQVLLLELVMAGALPDVRRDLRRALAVNQAVEAGMINAARMQHGAAAHGAGLQRDIERAAIEPVVAQMLRRCAQRHDFRVCGGVVPQHRCVAARGNHLAILDHHRPHRHFARQRCGLCLGQRLAHPVRVLLQLHCYIFNSC